MVKVLSVGGSVVAPKEPDTAFLAAFSAMVRSWLAQDVENRLILVVGGGAPARKYQKAYSDVCSIISASAQAKVSEKQQCACCEKSSNKSCSATEADWIGITATRLNAQLVRAIFSDLCPNDVVCDPIAPFDFDGRILVAAGWKPGFSTDTDAIYLAERFCAKTVVNLSNIEKVFTDDPRTNPDAQPIDSISWADFRKMVGDEWTPGKNCPFDPIASKKAESAGISVICAAGKNIKNIQAILNEKEFVGTKIG